MLFVNATSVWKPAPPGGTLFRRTYCNSGSKANRVEILNGDGNEDLYCVRKKPVAKVHKPEPTAPPVAGTAAPSRPVAEEPEEIATEPPEIATAPPEEFATAPPEEFATAPPEGADV